MNYMKIYPITTSDGPGCRTSLYVSGCNFHCEGCHNPEAWDFNAGKEFNSETLNYLLKCVSPEYIKGLSILGGEPLNSKNILVVKNILKIFKTQYPTKDVWVWTGFSYKELDFEDEIFKYIDVLITEPFKIRERDITKNNLWRGSRNQRVLDIKKTLQNKYFVGLDNVPNNEVF